MTQTITSDFLIIGSGIAGLSLAIKASAHGTVSVVTKRACHESATQNAQGGIAVVISKEDSFEAHIQDTLRAGGGICHEEAVRLVVTQAPERLKDLIQYGVKFTETKVEDISAEQQFQLGMEGGHSHRRILHVGDYTGFAIEEALVNQVRKIPKIKIYEYHFAVNIISLSKMDKSTPQEKDACAGVYALDGNTGEVKTFLAKATALCTGGGGKAYLYTSNPDVCTGDGMALAYRAGAHLSNMEMVQFHPTCLYHPTAKNFLISEALRGEGAFLTNKAGDRFVQKVDPRGDLSPRDVVARAIDAELKKSGDECVFLDISHKDPEYIKKRFPKIYKRCQAFDIDITKTPIPVVPAAHYFCGGVKTDIQGNTSLNRLTAVGEVAHTGIHGANRLASNSLPEALVFAHQVAETWKQVKDQDFPLSAKDVPPWNPGKARDPDEQVVISQLWDEIRRFMWNYVGIVRTTKRLERAKRRVEALQTEIRDYYWDFTITPDLLELRNIAIVAETVIRCSLQRQESRGLHYNADFPLTDDKNWKKATIIQREKKQPLAT